MNKSIAILAAVAALTATSAAEAGIPVTVQVACPLTGENFNFETTASYSTWGRDLDGLPQGSWTFPLAIPQCPGTRFPALEDLTPEQIEAARLLVETPEYQAIQGEAPYYVLAHVMDALDMGEPADHAWNLLQATWQAREDAATYGRYAAELSESWDAAAPGFRQESPEDWAWIETFVANVERQAGRADAASARLDALEGAELEDAELAERIALTRRLISEGDTRPHSPEREF